MADCITVTQLLSPLCCDATTVTGNVVISLVGPQCQLFDASNSSWLTAGTVGTFAIGTPTANTWTSCPLACLDQLTGTGGVTAINLGFYYQATVTVTGSTPCVYKIYLDCATLGLTPGSTVPLEDVITNTPSTGGGTSGLCAAIKGCETTTTLVDNGDSTYTYTNEDGATTIITAGTGTGTGGNSTLTAAGSVITHTSGSGTVVSFDICDIVANNCENTLVFNATTGDLSFTQHGGTTQTVNIGSNETITTLVNNGDGTFSYTSENGTVTSFDTTAGTGSTSSVTGTQATGKVIGTHSDGAATPVSTPIRETITTYTANANGTYTFTSEDGTVTTTAIPGAETVTTMVNNADGSHTYTNEAGVAVIIPASAGDPSEVVQTVITGNQIAVHDNNAATPVLTPIFETVTTYVANANGTFTYTSEDGTVTTTPVPGDGNTSVLNQTVAAGNQIATHNSGAVGAADEAIFETVTTLTVAATGVATYTNEAGVATTFRTSDTEKMSFAHPTAVTSISKSGLAIDDNAYEIYAYAVTVGVAPTGGAESFDLIDAGPTGTGTTNIFSGSLPTGARTTGIVALGTPYTVAAGNMVESNILTVGGTTPSERWSLVVFYRELISELATP